jgi:hypothetical protein
LPDPLPGQQFPIEWPDETPSRFDQNRMAHGRDRCDAALKQTSGDRRRGIGSGDGALAGFQKEKRDAMISHDCSDGIGADHLATPLLKLPFILGVLKAKLAETVLAVIDSMAIEVNHVVWLSGGGGPSELFLQRRESRRLQQREPGQFTRSESASTSGLALARWSI